MYKISTVTKNNIWKKDSKFYLQVKQKGQNNNGNIKSHKNHKDYLNYCNSKVFKQNKKSNRKNVNWNKEYNASKNS